MKSHQDEQLIKKAFKLAKEFGAAENRMWEKMGNETFFAATYLPCQHLA